MFDLSNVSYGAACSGSSSKINKFKFKANVQTKFEKIDERNLIHCKFLNLKKSSISQLDTIQLESLLILDISETKI